MNPADHATAERPQNPSIPRPEQYDALSKEVLEQPYDFFQSLRQYAPVYQIPGTNWYTVSRYEDIKAITLNPEDFSSNLTSILMSGPNGEPTSLERPELDTGPVDVLALADPPIHNAQRRLGLNLEKSVRSRMIP